MNWRLFFARDAWIWSAAWWIGVIWTTAVGIIAIDGSEAYSIGPVTWKWIVLVSALITAITGKLGLSPLAKKVDVETQGRLL